MTTPIETVRAFYTALGRGDAVAALGLMDEDVERDAMGRYGVDGRGPQRVAVGVFRPLISDGSSFALVPTDSIAEGASVLSLGRFTGVHAASAKTADAGYAHVWAVVEGRIWRFWQDIDTRAVSDAER